MAELNAAINSFGLVQTQLAIHCMLFVLSFVFHSFLNPLFNCAHATNQPPNAPIFAQTNHLIEADEEKKEDVWVLQVRFKAHQSFIHLFVC